jgi:hypothetical protein
MMPNSTVLLPEVVAAHLQPMPDAHNVLMLSRDAADDAASGAACQATMRPRRVRPEHALAGAELPTTPSALVLPTASATLPKQYCSSS